MRDHNDHAPDPIEYGAYLHRIVDGDDRDCLTDDCVHR